MPAAQPVCPMCGAVDEGAPDSFGVHGCRGCGIEFRPPLRVPIRRAGISEGREGKGGMWWLAVVVGIAVAIGRIAADDDPTPAQPPPYRYEPIQIPEAPRLDPAMLEALDYYGEVELEHVVHHSKVHEGQLHATGLLHNREPGKLREVRMQVHFRRADRSVIATHSGAVACPIMAANEYCAWALDAPVPADMIDYELEGSARRSVIEDLFVPVDLRASFDAEGRPLAGSEGLELELEEGTLSFSLDEGLMTFEGWATITSFDEQGSVLDVTHTRWAEPLMGAPSYTKPVAISQRGGARYEVRVGGSTLDEAPGTTTGIGTSLNRPVIPPPESQ